MESFLKTLRPDGERPVVLVTGASAGLGRIFAERLASKGCNIILAARREERLKELQASLRNQYAAESLVVPIDLAQPGSARVLYDAVKKAGWHTDILVNNAGFGYYGPFLRKNASEITQLCQLNITTVAELTRYILPAMVERRRGAIVNVGSLAGLIPNPMLGVYAASKAFLLSFSQALALECESSNVRVLCVCPGATATEFDQVAMGFDDPKGRLKEASPEMVVDSALDALARNRWVDFPGLAFKAQALMLKVAPSRLVMRSVMRFVTKRFREAGSTPP